jgi:hypothetical protein
MEVVLKTGLVVDVYFLIGLAGHVLMSMTFLEFPFTHLTVLT